MTSAAKKFISPLTFEAISQSQVLDDTNESWSDNSIYNHINIGKWADIFVLAPLTANSLNKLAAGIADNILTQTILAYTGPKLICPAANTNMIENPISVKAIKHLKSLGYKVLDPITKQLICRDTGNGAMTNIYNIYYDTMRILNSTKYWTNRAAIVTGGGTIEKIDDVRYISNFSSGKMAAALATALYIIGANVTLIASRGYERIPYGVKLIKVQSSAEMTQNLKKLLAQISAKDKINYPKPYLFMAAAVCDYIPVYKKGKLKKTVLGSSWNLILQKNIDILGACDTKNLFAIGFKAEFDATLAKHHAQEMLLNKSLDAVCLNVISNDNFFGSERNNIELIIKNKTFSLQGDKTDLSLDLVNKLADIFS